MTNFRKSLSVEKTYDCCACPWGKIMLMNREGSPVSEGAFETNGAANYRNNRRTRNFTNKFSN